MPSAAIKLLNEQLSKIGLCYNIHTTNIIRYACSKPNIDLPNLLVCSLSDIEMELFLNFFYDNPVLQAIGFTDSSALFHALRNNYSLVIMDKVTERICNQLNISTIKVEDIIHNLRIPHNQDSSELFILKSTCSYQRNLTSQENISSLNKRRLMTG